MIKTILWDVDNTLLNFHTAERAAIRTLFEEFGLGECTDEMLSRYAAINTGFWQRLERNEVTKAEVLIGRFEQFFSEYGIDDGSQLAYAFNERYQLALGDTIAFCDDSPSVIRSLRGKVRQYVVSNGTVVAQTKKLAQSGLGDLMDGVFLSEGLGVEKPNIGFFEKVFAAIGVDYADIPDALTDQDSPAGRKTSDGEGSPDALSTVMIVGDSLTSDILGGMNAGIRTCWYNPGRKPLPEGYRVDYMISDLHEVPEIVELAWEEISREHIIQNQWIDFRKSAYRYPDGRVFEPFYSYSRRDYVVIAATDTEGGVICVRQFRQGIKAVTTEFPAGGIERQDGREYRISEDSIGSAGAAEDALSAARRELMEETGYVSDEWEHLLTIPANATIADNYAHIFRAKNCRKVGNQHLDETEILHVLTLSPAKIEEMIRTGKFQQAVHVLAWLLANRS